MKVSLIVLNYNDAETTCSFLEKIKEFKIINNIVVVDNNSTDNSYLILKKYENKKIIVIRTPRNGGYSYGNNYGVKYAEEKLSSDYYIISNPDIIIEEGVIAELVNYLRSNEKIAMAAPKMKDKQGKEVTDLAWKIPTFKDDLILSLSVLTKIFNNPVSYNYEYLHQKEAIVEVLPGSFFVIKSGILKEIEYFDENTFLYCEERILGFKLKHNGYFSVLLNEFSYIHFHGKSINKSIKDIVKQYSILQKSREYYLCTYLHINRAQLLFFKCVTLIGRLEKALMNSVKRLSV